MKLLKTKKFLLLITSILLCGKAYAQSSNMQLPNQVGIYNPNIKAPQMHLPQQVGVYQTQNRPINMMYPMIPQQQNPNTHIKIDYNKAPVMNTEMYNNVNGFKSPNRYTLQNARIQTQNQTPKENEYGIEYYMGIGYGSGSFEGEGLIYKGNEYYPPMNEISEGLGDPKSLTIGFGVMQDRKVSIEVNYTNLSGLNYDKYAYATEQWCGPWDFGDDFYYDCNEELSTNGGGITSNALMINVQVPLTDIFGTLFDGFITPYIGGGVGISFNTIDDYTIYDDFGDAEIPIPDPTTGELGNPEDADGNYLGGWYDENGTITHFGATTNNISWNIEAGLTFNIDKKTMFDVYYKMSNYGTVKSKDTIFYSYDTIDIVDPTEELNTSTDGYQDYCTAMALEYGFEYNDETGWCEAFNGTTAGFLSGFEEKGKIETTEIGVKLRLIF